MVKLIYPTVDVFIYDLRQTLLDTKEQIATRRSRFLQKVYQDAILKQKIAEIKNREAENADYIKLIAETFEGDLDGFYYALQFNDSYSLQVNYSGEKRAEASHNEPIELEKIANYKKIIVEHINKTKVLSDSENEIVEEKKGSLGQTWLVWGQLETERDLPLEIAKNCYQQLAPQIFRKEIPLLPEETTADRLLGGYFFELWQHPSLKEDYHLLVWLFPPEPEISQIKQTVETTYFDLTRLLLYRHKINLAYRESQTLREQIKEKYELIYRELNLLEKHLESRKYNLDDLRNKLTSNLRYTAEYTDLLNRLKTQALTIEVNLNNYQKRLKAIQQKDTNNKLNNLENFINYVSEKYQQDIQSTYSYFSSGTILLEQTIKTIEGIINIEQTQSDRNLNELVAVVSSGLGAGAITASLISAQPPTGKTALEFYKTNFALAFFVAIIGGFIGFLLWKIYLWWSGSRRKKIVSSKNIKG